MTPTTAPPAVQSPRKKLPIVLITNICVAVFMLVAIPVIHQGQKGFVPYTTVDKQYVNAAISSGEAEFMHNALKTTEIARAMAYDSHVSTMTIMQVAVAVLAVLFFFNSFFLFRLHRQPQAPRLPRVS